MKIATIVARLILGLLYLASSSLFFLNMMPQQEHSEPATQFLMGLAVTGYLLPFMKIIELVSALSLISGRLVSLAAVVIFPITLNIVLFHLFLAQEGALIAVVMLATNLFIAYSYRDRYRQLFSWK